MRNLNQFEYFHELDFFLDRGITYDLNQVDLLTKDQDGNTVLHHFSQCFHKAPIEKIKPILFALMQKDLNPFEKNNEGKNCFQVQKTGYQWLDILMQDYHSFEHLYHPEIKGLMLQFSKRPYKKKFLQHIDTFSLLSYGFMLNKEKIQLIENVLHHDYDFHIHAHYRFPRHAKNKFNQRPVYMEMSDKQKKDVLMLKIMTDFIRLYHDKSFKNRLSKYVSQLENYQFDYAGLKKDFINFGVFTVLLKDSSLQLINKKICACFYQVNLLDIHKKFDDQDLYQCALEELHTQQYHQMIQKMDIQNIGNKKIRKV